MRLRKAISSVVPRLYFRISPMTQPAFETVRVSTREVACDGGGGPLGHPKVYLHIDQDKGDSVTCPYCSRLFVLAHAHQPTAA